MLRFAFHAVLNNDETTRRFLVEFSRELKGYLSELKTQRQLMRDTTPLQARLALEAGIEQVGASARWASKSLRYFQGEKAGKHK
jgi:hypothetical protein